MTTPRRIALRRIALRRSGFRAWLQARKPGEEVGFRGTSCDCPLAQFLREAGGHDAEILARTYEVDAQERRLCEWARRFVQEVDGGGRCLGPVTAAEALAVLDGLP